LTHRIKEEHRKAIISAIGLNERVKRAVLFGSRAMGSNTITSDVDIVLYGDQLTLTDQAGLGAVIEQIPMAQSVDLVLHNSIRDESLLDHIQRCGVEWYVRSDRKPAHAPQ